MARCVLRRPTITCLIQDGRDRAVARGEGERLATGDRSVVPQEEGLLLEHLAEVHGAAGEHAEAERLRYAAEHVTRQCAVLRSLVEQQPENQS